MRVPGLTLASILLILVGCGQTGPLYLPDQQPASNEGTPAPSAPTPPSVDPK